jgi:glycosyltransferase involved in cell wall biosynthesis
MIISFLLHGINPSPSGGPFMLYKFMDMLSRRGHQVYAITRASRIKWTPDLSGHLPGKQTPLLRKKKLRSYIKKLMQIALGREKTQAISAESRSNSNPKVLWRRTLGLVNNWTPSDITIATHWTTAHAAYLLMDKTVPLYYIQMYEELFGKNEIERKQARLTYFMPLVLMAGSYWIKDQIKERIQKDAYLLQPGIPAINCLDQGLKLDLKKKFMDAPKIKILAFAKDKAHFGFPDMVEAMRIVFSKLGRDNIEWNIFSNNPSLKLPDGIPINLVQGRGKQLIPLFLDSHIALHASWYNGFAGGALETMSAGTAAITTASNSEGVLISGQNCLTVPNRDINAFARDIIRLIQDRELCLKLAQGGLKTASEFSWDKVTDNLEKIIRETAANYPYKGKFADIPELLKGNVTQPPAGKEAGAPE